MKKVQFSDPSTGATISFTQQSQQLNDLFENEPFGQDLLQDFDDDNEGPIQVQGPYEFVEEKDELFGKLLDPDSHSENNQKIYFNNFEIGAQFFRHEDSSIQAPNRSPAAIQQSTRIFQRKKQKGKQKSSQEKDENFHKKFKKNVNMPKAIGRYLMDYYSHFKETLFSQDQKYYETLVAELQERKLWVRRSKKNSIKLKDLEFYFGDRIRTRRQSCINRLMMRKIIQKWSREEIIPNNQVKDKLQYLVATKVYALRCSNSNLATRMQMR